MIAACWNACMYSQSSGVITHATLHVMCGAHLMAITHAFSQDQRYATPITISRTILQVQRRAHLVVGTNNVQIPPKQDQFSRNSLGVLQQPLDTIICLKLQTANGESPSVQALVGKSYSLQYHCR